MQWLGRILFRFFRRAERETYDKFKLSESWVARVTSNRVIDEPWGVKGTMTVIKNKGRADEQVICKSKPNLVTNVGRDRIHNLAYTLSGLTSETGDTFHYIGLSANTTAPAASDTSLAGEITTNGLARVEASSHTHATGTNTTTIQNTFTATGTHTGVQKAGLWNGTGGSAVLGHANTFTSVNLANNDTLTIVWTITLG